MCLRTVMSISEGLAGLLGYAEDDDDDVFMCFLQG